MKKLIVIATLALAGCNEESRAYELDKINDRLPKGCAVADVGGYANISHVLVVVCDGAKTISTNTSWVSGKTTQNAVTLQIMGEQ
jgi:hypothetical protein